MRQLSVNLHGKIRRRGHGREGLTLVELLVVMAILAILAGLTAPALLTFRPSDALEGATRELFTTLKFAQVHAASQRVETAIVYLLDNYTAIEADPGNEGELREPLQDSVSGAFQRIVTGYAAVERIKDEALAQYVRAITGVSQPVLFAPLDSERGNFQAFDASVALLLSPPTLFSDPYYRSGFPRYIPNTAAASNADPGYVNSLGALGMTDVYVVFGLEDARDARDRGVSASAVAPGLVTVAPFPGHRFKPTGGMTSAFNSPERFTVHVALRPTADPDARVRAGQELVAKGIDLFKSTGRVRIVSP